MIGQFTGAAVRVAFPVLLSRAHAQTSGREGAAFERSCACANGMWRRRRARQQERGEGRSQSQSSESRSLTRLAARISG